ncbi:hypothetical protein PPM_p0238 (plasmid) [Paenibacillus polymyxa M1]|uniref:hypothetical protein n=1 Tax=Paenibacillus polymyxa TaxID=1406 RepID=UPI00021BBA78|nr:hypothetical protein [Paenibacillus polymyxa]CCC86388.1 hypothetical protein PPM_p0238 [Paenibacillus polymyxa M1]
MNPSTNHINNGMVYRQYAKLRITKRLPKKEKWDFSASSAKYFPSLHLQLLYNINVQIFRSLQENMRDKEGAFSMTTALLIVIVGIVFFVALFTFLIIVIKRWTNRDRNKMN